MSFKAQGSFEGNTHKNTVHSLNSPERRQTAFPLIIKVFSFIDCKNILTEY